MFVGVRGVVGMVSDGCLMAVWWLKGG